MREYAGQRSLRRIMIRVPVLSPRLSSLWLGLVGLTWWLGTFLERCTYLMAKVPDAFSKAVGVGALGSLVGFAVSGFYSCGLVRGIALPFIFILTAALICAREAD